MCASNEVCGVIARGLAREREWESTCTRWETTLTNADLGQAAMLDLVDKPLEEDRHGATLDFPVRCLALQQELKLDAKH